MPQNKYQIIRYQALDKCFRNNVRRYFIEDLIDACNEALYNFSGSSEGIKKRQLYDNIKDKFSDVIDDKLLDFIDKKLEFYNKMTEDKVNSQFKNLWFNEIYDHKVRGIWK